MQKTHTTKVDYCRNPIRSVLICLSMKEHISNKTFHSSLIIVISLLFISCEGLLGSSASPANSDSGQPEIVRTWGQDAILDTGSSFAINPQIEYNSKGHAMAIWQQNLGSNYRIMTRFFNGNGWEDVVRIDDQVDTGGGICSRPQIILNDSGNAMAVWNQYNTVESLYHIYACYFDGTSWEAPIRIDNSSTNVSFPQISMNSNDTAVAVWQEGTFTHDSIYAARYDKGVWKAPEALESGNDNKAQSTSVVIDKLGKAIVIWEQKVNGIYNVYYNIFEGSDWNGPVCIDSDDVNNATYPVISMNSSGHAMICWSQPTVGDVPAVKARFYNGTSFGSEMIVVSEDISYYVHNDLILNDEGRAAVVYWCMDGSEIDAGISRYNGMTWNTSLTVIDSISSIVRLDISKEGHIMLIWSKPNVDNSSILSIWSKSFDGTEWGDSLLLESDDSGTAKNPQIVFSSTGEAMAIWEQNDSTVYNIKWNHYK